LEELKEEGLFENIGVSNYQLNDLKALLKICEYKPLVNQIEYNPIMTQDDLIDFCTDNQIEVQGYCIIKPYLNKSMFQNFNDVDRKIIDTLVLKYDKTFAQILIR
jgi:diketogulonate reductase-like aldo/keto reductase